MGTDNNLLLEPVQEILEHSLVLVSKTQIDLLWVGSPPMRSYQIGTLLQIS